MRRKRWLGMGLAVTAASLWGVSGPASEYLFEHGVKVSWLISSKMVLAGLVTMVLALTLRGSQAVMAPWRSKKAALKLVIFILFGMVAMQYIYFQAVAVANAPTATILQFLAPVLILSFVAIKARKLPSKQDLLVIVCAMFGTVLVVTKGHITSLAISSQALFWGLMAAVAAAGYTLLPADLLATYDPLVITAWAQLAGGLGLSVFVPFWRQMPNMNATGWWLYAFIVVMGTLVAYLAYLMALRFIPPTMASLLEAFEPLGATITSVVFLGLRLSFAELLGGLIIIATVGMMAVLTPNSPPSE